MSMRAGPTDSWQFDAPTLPSINITPANASLPIGQQLQFHATGTYSDSSTADLTANAFWGFYVPHGATLTSGGLATGTADGTSAIIAQIGGDLAYPGTANVAILTVGHPPDAPTAP